MTHARKHKNAKRYGKAHIKSQTTEIPNSETRAIVCEALVSALNTQELIGEVFQGDWALPVNNSAPKHILIIVVFCQVAYSWIFNTNGHQSPNNFGTKQSFAILSRSFG